MFNGIGLIPPATAVNYVPWIITGWFFQSFMRRRHFSWWTRYNYILSAALDCGVAVVRTLLRSIFSSSNPLLSPDCAVHLLRPAVPQERHHRDRHGPVMVGKYCVVRERRRQRRRIPDLGGRRDLWPQDVVNRGSASLSIPASPYSPLLDPLSESQWVKPAHPPLHTPHRSPSPAPLICTKISHSLVVSPVASSVSVVY